MDEQNIEGSFDSVSIKKLRLEQHTVNLLKDAGIETVGGIIETEKGKGLLRVRNIGKAHYRAIEAAMLEIGLALDGTPARIEVYDMAGQSAKPAPPAEQAPPAAAEPGPEAASEPPVEPAATAALPQGSAEPEPMTPATQPPEPAPEAQPIAGASPSIPAQPAEALPRTVVFVDYENWFCSLRELHQRRPNIQTWFADLKKRGRLLEVTFFGDFSESGGLKDEIANIRMYTNRIIETQNPSEYSKKDFTDFIMLDSIYQKVIASPEIEQVVLFTGDGHFASVASYLRNFLSKVVGVYGVDRAISNQLEAISDWCVRIPFVDEPYMECRDALLKNLKYAEEHSKSPTFQATVRIVADYYNLPDDAVEAELRLLLREGVVYSVSERSRRDYRTMLNILKVNWSLAGKPDT